MRPSCHAKLYSSLCSTLLGMALLHGTPANAGVLLQAAPGEPLAISASGNAFAALLPKAGTVLSYTQYDAITPTLTLSEAMQQFSAYSPYLSQRQVDFQASRNSTSGTDYTKESHTYRFTDGSCSELDLMFDSSGKLAGKRTYMQLPDALTSSSLNFFDDSVSSSLTLDQARQFIGSSGVQTGINYFSFNGGSDSSWRWERSDHQASIQLNFNASGSISFLSQWQKTVNTTVNLFAVYSRLQPGMSLADVRSLLGGNGALTSKNFAQPQQTNFNPSTAYYWNDASGNQVRVEFINNTLSWTQAAGPDFGKNSLAALLSAADLNRVTLGSTADNIKSIFGTPSNNDPYNLIYRDSDGSNLSVWISPNYIPAPPPSPSTTPTAPNTTPTPPTPTPPTVVYQVSGAGIYLQCQAQDPYTITGTTSGTIANRSLVANITVDPADQGKSGNIYILAALPYGMGVLALTQSAGWQQIVSPSQTPAYATVTLGTHTIPVLDGKVDLSSVPGIRFFAIYTLAQQDLLKDGKGQQIDNLKP